MCVECSQLSSLSKSFLCACISYYLSQTQGRETLALRKLKLRGCESFQAKPDSQPPCFPYDFPDVLANPREGNPALRKLNFRGPESFPAQPGYQNPCFPYTLDPRGVKLPSPTWLSESLLSSNNSLHLAAPRQGNPSIEETEFARA